MERIKAELSLSVCSTMVDYNSDVLYFVSYWEYNFYSAIL